MSKSQRAVRPPSADITRFARHAEQAVRSARAQALADGLSVVEVSGGDLVECFPDGTRHVIKPAPVPLRVPPGTIRRRT